ncbi:hypothetical protein LZ554_000821 [Drepanopeziza brunnea f. sp. 'monogermtubi']|nr:hypothetical protein LZ554_000821 [Drepanopeziza brunnea f. sp. 'monogermtubi']
MMFLARFGFRSLWLCSLITGGRCRLHAQELLQASPPPSAELCPTQANPFNNPLVEHICIAENLPQSSYRDNLAGSSSTDDSRSPKPACIAAPASLLEYCIYTFPAFANGRGISILASNESIAAVEDAIHANPAPLVSLEASQPPQFFEQEIAGRGKGLICNSTITKGTLILASTPVFLIQESAMRHLPETERLSLQREAVSRLPRRTKTLFYDLAGHFGVDETEDVLLTNGFSAAVGKSKDGFGIVVPEAARLNHDCRPNARFAFDRTSLTHRVHATRTIHPGDEITFSYIDGKQDFATRQAVIHAHWGFQCRCSLCSSPESLRAESDARLARIGVLRKQLLPFDPEQLLDDSLEKAAELVRLYEGENLSGALAEAYMAAALWHCFENREEETRNWALKAVDHCRWAVLQLDTAGSYYRSNFDA